MNYKGLTITLYPTEEQKVLMRKTADNVRFAYNWGLRQQLDAFEQRKPFIEKGELKKRFRAFRNAETEDGRRLRETAVKSCIQALDDLYEAYYRYIDQQKQKNYVRFSKKKIAHFARIGRKLTIYHSKGHPKFKDRTREVPTFWTQANQFYFLDGKCSINGVGMVTYKTDHKITECRMKEVKCAKTRVVHWINPRVKYVNGKWILTVTTEVETEDVPLEDYALGIDLGLKTLATVSYDGGKELVIHNVNKEKRVKRLEKRHRHAQRVKSRRFEARKKLKQKEYSDRLKRSLDNVARLYRKMANIRRDHVHKATRQIVDLHPKKIVMEDLNVAGLRKNRHLSKSISDACWAKFIQQIEYKTKYIGVEFVQVDRYYPSSKICSRCGNKKTDLKLSDRTYHCERCGLVIDRDLNAAKNLEQYNK